MSKDMISDDCDHTSHLLTGSSMIRDVSSTDSGQLAVQSISGAKIPTIKCELEKTETTYDEVSIVVGTNDCDDNSSNTVSLKEEYSNLLQCAKKVGKIVEISSVLPHINSKCSTAHLKTSQMNQELKQMCPNDSQCHFIDNDMNFTLSDNSPNDAMYLSDGIHLTSKGSSKLMENLGLSKLTSIHKGNQGHHNKKYRRHSFNRSNSLQIGPHTSQYQQPHWQPTDQGYRRRHGHHYGQQERFNNYKDRHCFNCGVLGHIRSQCKSPGKRCAS